MWIIYTGPNSCIAMSHTKFMNIPLWHASLLHVSTWSILMGCASFYLKYSYGVCFLRLWIICKGTKPLCLGPLKHGETWRICHKSCIYLSTTMRTQVSYTICHSHISADNAHHSNLRKNTVLKLPRNKICYIFNCIYWSPLGLDTYRLSQKKS